MNVLELDILNPARVRLIRQTEIAECGIACLAMVADFHGLKYDLGTLRRRFAPSMRGATLKSLVGLADSIGLTPRAVKLPLEDLQNLHAPCILHWDMNHFVVLESVKRGKALIHDPSGRSIAMPIEDVSKHFTGVALELRPNDSFKKGDGRERFELRQLLRSVTGLKRTIAQTLALTLLLQIYVLASPYYMQVAIDNALPALDNNLLAVLAIGFGLFTVINAGATFLRSFVLLVAGASMGFSVASNVARRLFRLPISWFEKRHTGDILSRFQSVMPIQKTLIEGSVAAIVDGVLVVLTLVLMFWYSLQLALVAILAFTLYAVVRVVSFSFERQAQEAEIVMAGKEQTTLIETLHGIVTLRLSGQEMMRHAYWQNKLTDSVNADVRMARIRIWQSTANTLIFGLENIFTIYLAISLVIDGSGFSVGMIFAFMAYKTQFIQKSSALVDTAISFKILNLHLERLSDITLADEDVSFDIHSSYETDLTGEIELRDLHYRYSATDPMVLSGVNLKVQKGEFIAITGPSGGGKSTLVKLLLGLVEPEAGEVIVDGLPISNFGYKSYHRQIGAVLQDDNLFAGTLAENIALFDERVDLERVINAAKAASIHSDIVQMPMKYDSLVGDMGSTLSGGQKQRVLLARALYRRPKILLMDEGTAHLDAKCERSVNEALSSMGITRIVIAHRQETLDAAQRVLFMHEGKLHNTE